MVTDTQRGSDSSQGRQPDALFHYIPKNFAEDRAGYVVIQSSRYGLTIFLQRICLTGKKCQGSSVIWTVINDYGGDEEGRSSIQ